MKLTMLRCSICSDVNALIEIGTSCSVSLARLLAVMTTCCTWPESAFGAGGASSASAMPVFRSVAVPTVAATNDCFIDSLQKETSDRHCGEHRATALAEADACVARGSMTQRLLNRELDDRRRRVLAAHHRSRKEVVAPCRRAEQIHVDSPGAVAREGEAAPVSEEGSIEDFVSNIRLHTTSCIRAV